MFRICILALALIACDDGKAVDEVREVQPPQEIGSRTVVLDFKVDKNSKPVDIELVSSEALGLNPWAKSMVLTGHVRKDSPGVIKLKEGKFRASISFPVKDDGAPLPAEITLPKRRIHPVPAYPYALAKENTTGGVLLRLTINDKAKITNLEVVRASHDEFIRPTVHAVKKWEFAEPAKNAGVKMEVILFQLVTFEIAGKPPAPWEWQACPEPALPVFTVTGGFISYEALKKLPDRGK